MQRLSDQMIECLLAHAQAESPKECCGAFFRDEESDVTILQPYTNKADHPEHEFLIDPMEYMQSKMIYGLPPVAFYHSHPHSPPNLSAKDTTLMDALVTCGLDVPMIVVGLQPSIEIRCYQRQGHVYRVLWKCAPAILKEVPA